MATTNQAPAESNNTGTIILAILIIAAIAVAAILYMNNGSRSGAVESVTEAPAAVGEAAGNAAGAVTQPAQ